jgi:hypothetical protein
VGYVGDDDWAGNSLLGYNDDQLRIETFGCEDTVECGIDSPKIMSSGRRMAKN